MLFSIIIATCDRPQRLAKTLAAVRVAVENSGEKHRLLVADNGPDWNAAEVTAQFADSVDFPVSYLRCAPRDRCRALNRAVQAADTRWLAFTDDDTLPAAHWLKQAAAYAEKAACRIFGGRILPGEPEGPLPKWLRADRTGRTPGHVIFVRYEPRDRSGILGLDDPLPFGANFFAEKSLFVRYGGLDESLYPLLGRAALGGDDTEFEARVRAHGECIGYCHEAVVIHPVHHERANLRSQIRLAYEYGWRDPIVFFEPDRPLVEFYRWRQCFRWAWAAIADGVAGRSADAVASLLKLARAMGEMRCRFSAAYRARAAEWRKRQTRTALAT